MGIRSQNCIVLKPEIKLTPEVTQYLNPSRTDIVRTEHGMLICYESNFTPLWARDGKGECCTLDLEEEVAVHRFLGSLPQHAFYMVRAGAECGRRGNWAVHPFRDNPEVQAIEEAYAAKIAEAGRAGVAIDKFALKHTGANPHGYTADATRTGDTDIFEEVRISVYDTEGDCVGDVLVGLTEDGEPRALVTTDGDGDGDHTVSVMLLKPKDEAVSVS